MRRVSTARLPAQARANYAFSRQFMSIESRSGSALSTTAIFTTKRFCTTRTDKPLDDKPQEHYQTFESAFKDEATTKAETDQSNTEVPNKILESALKCVPHYGWTTEALAQGAVEAGYSGITGGLFPRGPAELVEYWLDKVDEQVREKAKGMDMSSMNMKEKIKAIMRARLELFIPYMGTWQQALGILAHPSNLQFSMQRLYNVINEMWYLVGDKSTDFDWYTKRALVATAYTATELYMLTDGSENYENTWDFLDRRIDDITTLSKYKTEVADFCNLASGIASSMVSSAAKSSPFGSSVPPFKNPLSGFTTTNTTNTTNTTASTTSATDTLFKASEVFGGTVASVASAASTFAPSLASFASSSSPLQALQNSQNLSALAGSLISTAVNVFSHLGQQQQAQQQTQQPQQQQGEENVYEEEIGIHHSSASSEASAVSTPVTPTDLTNETKVITTDSVKPLTPVVPLGGETPSGTIAAL